MSWSKQHPSFSENPFNKPIIDRCINCGQTKEIKTTITMEYEGSLNTGPICKKCYSTNQGPRIAQF
jgi:hypothetical protein